MATQVLVEESHGATGGSLDATPRTVTTSLNYYDDPGDGSPPTPVVIGG